MRQKSVRKLYVLRKIILEVKNEHRLREHVENCGLPGLTANIPQLHGHISFGNLAHVESNGWNHVFWKLSRLFFRYIKKKNPKLGGWRLIRSSWPMFFALCECRWLFLLLDFVTSKIRVSVTSWRFFVAFLFYTPPTSFLASLILWSSTVVIVTHVCTIVKISRMRRAKVKYVLLFVVVVVVLPCTLFLWTPWPVSPQFLISYRCCCYFKPVAQDPWYLCAMHSSRWK